MDWRTFTALSALCLAACRFDTGGVGEGGATPGDGGSGDGANTGSSSSPATTDGVTTTPVSASSDGSTTFETTTVDPTQTGTGTGSEPILEISDAPLFDFGNVDIQGSAEHTFTVTNIGGGPATGLGGQLAGAGYRFGTGDFPGGGDCTDTLDPGESCTVGVEFRPATFVAYPGQLDIKHAGGIAAREIDGFGIGTTGNLLENGDAETLGDPPPGWTEIAGSNWRASAENMPPRTGSGHLWSGPHGGTDPSELRQELDVAMWAPLTDDGLVRLDFSGWARTWSTDNDQYRFVLEARNAIEVLAAYDSDWQTGSSWREFTDVFVIPAGTLSLRMRVRARLDYGGTNTDAYFDDLVLTATYMP